MVATLEAAGFGTTPYHAYVPSFGEWGFVLTGVATPAPGTGYLAGLQFASAATVADMMWFPPDMAYLAVFHFVRQQ